ncbi:hypothetical protein BCR42DRAFT_23254 [Absidia repens]|uniref:FAS1 domain-containing protein n=1 Tax=Absidia repens TaxID=90262 RepID=A0A1X2IHX5_9FUNG|nr:hypothetical protein BCR42DRAFT_23254 [Absidia repens]
MLMKNGLMLLLSLASVSGQVIDCAPPSNDSSSGMVQANPGTQQNVDSPFDCPLVDSPSSSTTQSAKNSTETSFSNSTLFQLLNSTNSPVPKFMALITSSPEFKPLIDILSNPGNHTIFLPCDEALTALESMKNETNGNQTTSNDTSPSSSADSSTSSIQQDNLMSTILTGFHRRNILASDGNGTQNDNGNQTTDKTDNTTEVISQGLGNFSLVDILSYHVLNGSWPIKNISHGIHINDTLMSNMTAYPLANYVPLVIINNATVSNHSSSDNSTGSANDTTTSSANDTSSSNIITSHITFLANNATNVTAHSNSTSNITVGNGIGFAKLVVADITASNGILHIIDKVLVPPVSTVSAIEQLNETKVNAFLNQSSETSSLLDSANNVTIFLPSDEALQNYTRNRGSKMDTGSGENGNSSNVDMDQLIKNHIVNGTYYTSNVTTTPLNVTTLDGTQLQLKGNSNGTLFQVGNATIVKPDVLTNRAVVMVIDEVLQPNRTGSSSPSSSPSASATSGETESATSTTSAAFRLTSLSLVHILGTSLMSLLPLVFGLV